MGIYHFLWYSSSPNSSTPFFYSTMARWHGIWNLNIPLGTRAPEARVLVSEVHSSKNTGFRFISHFSLSLTRTHSQSHLHLNIQTPNPHTIGSRKPVGARRRRDLSLCSLTVNILSLSLSFTPKHTNPKPSLHRWQNTLIGGDLSALSLSRTKVNSLVLGLRLSFEIWMDSKLEILKKKKKNTELISCWYCAKKYCYSWYCASIVFLIFNYFGAWETRFL